MKNNLYKGRVYPEDAEWSSSVWTKLLKERYYISSLFCENKIVLDTCSGSGWGTVNYIIPKAKFTTAFDICEPPLLPQNEKYLFLQMDAKNIDLKAGAFNLVLALDSIEHFTMDDGIKYLSEIKKVCADDGFLLGTTPLVVDEALSDKFLAQNKYHLHMYTADSLVNTLSKIFPFVKIFEIYNGTCPYFLFFCAEKDINESVEATVSGFIKENHRRFTAGKILSYLSWAKSLIERKKIKMSFVLALKAVAALPELLFKK